MGGGEEDGGGEGAAIVMKDVASEAGRVDATDETGRGVEMHNVEVELDVETRVEAKGTAALGGASVISINMSAINAGGSVTAEINVAAPEPLPPPALHQLRAPPADFTGRRDELRELLAKIGTGGVAISGLTGQGGVGKTALGLVLAGELVPRYPDAQIDIDLRGVSAEPVTPAAAMAHVIHAWHPLAKLPDNEAELAAQYRATLHGKRALLFFDNARDRNQVAPLLPPAGSGCLVIVTSRELFHVPGLHALPLDMLREGDAVALLRAIVPQLEEAEAQTLAGLCGRLPFALELAAGTLAARIDLEPAEYFARLRTAEGQIGLVEGVLASSFEMLDAKLQAVWRSLGVFPGSFDREAAAAVAGFGVEEGAAALSELVRRSLVQFDTTAKRYRLHDLAQVYAVSRLREAERHAAERRHAEHFLGVTRAAGRLYEKGGASMMEGLALFDRNWVNIEAGQSWAAAHVADDAAAQLCSDYPDASVHCIDLRLHPRERIRWSDVALAAAQRLGQRSAEELHLGNMANAYLAQGESRRAIELYELALIIAREIADRKREGYTLGNMGMAYNQLGEPRKAIELYEQHLVIAREIGDRFGEGAALGNLGNTYADLGESRRALKLYEQVLLIAREIGDKRGEGASLGNMGNAYTALNKPRRALKLYEQRLVIACEIGDREGEGNALGNMGIAHGHLGESERAIELHEQALTIARAIGDRRGEGVSLGNMGNVYAALGEPRRAIELYEQHLAIAREIGDKGGAALTSWNLGGEYENIDDLPQAIAAMQVCVDFFREIGHPSAEEHAAYIDELRARLAGAPPPPRADPIVDRDRDVGDHLSNGPRS